MTREQTRDRRRGWIIAHYAGLVLMLPLVPLGRAFHPSWLLGVGVLILLTAWIAFSFDHAFGRTGLWTLIRKKAHELDERELQLTHTALATSYRWISIALLVAMYLIILGNDDVAAKLFGWVKPIAPVLAIGLIYVAHTLPMALIGWNELPAEEEQTEAAKTNG